MLTVLSAAAIPANMYLMSIAAGENLFGQDEVGAGPMLANLMIAGLIFAGLFFVLKSQFVAPAVKHGQDTRSP
eukprot:COSAG05_NODE_392_length_10391_cov_8.232899_2_plen_73_part_00